jgi:hypothetical protein
MTVNKIINARVPQIAVQAPNHGSAKKKEGFFWKRPLLYTALAVAGAAAILFIANGWGSSSSTPQTPPKQANATAKKTNPPSKPKTPQTNIDMVYITYKFGLWCNDFWTKLRISTKSTLPPGDFAVNIDSISPELATALNRIEHIATREELKDYLFNIESKDIPDEFIIHIQELQAGRKKTPIPTSSGSAPKNGI